MARRKLNKAILSARGFTLIEVIMAIIILSGALVVLLGLQSSVVNQTIRDRTEEKAMLLARRILASLESSNVPIAIGTNLEDGYQVLEDLEVVGGRNDMTKDEMESLKSFQVERTVSYWGIPNIDEHAMRQIVLRIRWSDAPEDLFEAVYYVPNDDDEKEAATK